MIDLARLKQIVSYDPDTGLFTWIAKTSQRTKIGQVAGCLDIQSGYWRLVLDGKGYWAHRVAWLYMTGEWPEHLVDHEDTVRSNNRWKNLRAADHSRNKANRKAPASNTSGLKGVVKVCRGSTWRAQIMVAGKGKHLGTFATKEEAHAAYLTAAQQYFGEFARGV